MMAPLIVQPSQKMADLAAGILPVGSLGQKCKKHNESGLGNVMNFVLD